MTGWGTPDQLINPATATGKFLDRMVKVADWQTVSPWTVAQKVQGSPSSDGGIYRDTYQQATAIVAALDTGTGVGRPQRRSESPSSRPPPPARPAGSRPPASAAAGRRPGAATRTGGSRRRALCPVPSAPALQLECGAATAFDQLNTAFKAAIRAGHRHHRRLPLLRRTGPMPPGEGQPVRQPRHLQPRLGQSRRHRRLLRRQHRHRRRPSTGSPPTPAATAGTTPPGRKPAARNPNPGTGNTAPSHDPGVLAAVIARNHCSGGRAAGRLKGRPSWIRDSQG